MGSGEFERSEDIWGMINVHVWDKREDGLQPEIHDSGPQDLTSETLICTLGFDSHLFSIHSPTNTLSL